MCIGDGIVFKHMMRVYFQPQAEKIPLDLEKDVRYEVKQEDYFPRDDVHALAMLMAEHSASIPDHLSISYLPVNKWKQEDFFMNKGNNTKNPLLSTSLSAGMGRKRTLSELQAASSSCSSLSNSPLVSPLSCGGVSGQSSIHIPKWIVAYFSKAMYSYGTIIFSNGLFSQCPYNLDTQRGFPEFVLPPNKVIEGASFNTRKLPCIVHMAMHGTIKIHSSCNGGMWIAAKAKHKNTDEELVYMKCWHPSCRLKVEDYRTKMMQDAVTNPSAYKFDAGGWALVRKQDLANVIGSVEVDKHAKI